MAGRNQYLNTEVWADFRSVVPRWLSPQSPHFGVEDRFAGEGSPRVRSRRSGGIQPGWSGLSTAHAVARRRVLRPDSQTIGRGLLNVFEREQYAHTMRVVGA